MDNLRYRNEVGQELDLFHGNGVFLLGMQGVSSSSVINTTSTSGFDGATFIGAQVPMRNIVLTVHVEDEDAKTTLYRLFQIKKTGTLFYQSATRSVKIFCYTESAECVMTTFPMTMQISLLCPQPYFESLNEMRAYLQGVVAAWEFPWEIPSPEGCELSYKSPTVVHTLANDSDTTIGMDIEFRASSDLVNPRIENTDTGEWLQLDVTMLQNDTITVTTQQGNKRITRRRGETVENLFNALRPKSTFLQLRPGENHFKHETGEGANALEVTLRYRHYYAGV